MKHFLVKHRLPQGTMRFTTYFLKNYIQLFVSSALAKRYSALKQELNKTFLILPYQNHKAQPKLIKIKMAYFIKLFSLLIFLSLNYSLCICQDWTKQKLQKNDTISSIYSLEAHDAYHSAFAEIILFKDGKFKYSAHYPLNNNEYSEGKFNLKNDTLSLVSDFQKNNMKVTLIYIDTITVGTSYARISFPRNLKGEIFYNAYYFINNDTTFKNQFDPMMLYHKEILDSIKSIMVKFYDMDCGSTWIPITNPNTFIKVIMMTDKNLDNDMEYKIINWEFKIKNDKLITIPGKNNSKNVN